MPDIKAELEFEAISKERARIWVVTTVDGRRYKNLHLSGKYEVVFAYYRGELHFEEARKGA